jgi:mannose-6-phosphate isomerase-like protein (cupin superfamily)
MATFETMRVPERHDVLAPDGSEIRLLPRLSGGSMVHCTLPVGGVSLAVTHRTVEEVWYVVEGEGQVWRRQGQRQETIEVGPGVSLTIPLGTHFQFRNTGTESLCIIIVTMPPWPGADEAIRVQDHWPVPPP